MPDLLRADGLVFGYQHTPVLRDVSMTLPAGGFVGILGPNGSGKTTLLRALAGTVRPARGRVLFEDRDIRSVARHVLARRMAVVPQETHLAFDYTALEVVMMGRYPHLTMFEIEGPKDFSIAREAMAATGTLPLQDRQFDTLSGGEKQRVIVAAALAQIAGAGGNGILLLDEPTVALDLAYQLELGELLRERQRRVPLTIAVSTHDLNFAASLCRTLVLLKDGRVLASGATDDVLTSQHIRELYDVEADVTRHPPTGRVIVVPVRRARAGSEA
ncbi:MAG TPA: ABC transporter ATP-binding protein [Vicinamibacterales bacterium]|jgi:ABC-type cobalamin/Fe3+-siderophores transport system ATPase subunit|nr:ABC transporter ATP-binding protein [Vicinamibacterales bacterium]